MQSDHVPFDNKHPNPRAVEEHQGRTAHHLEDLASVKSLGAETSFAALMNDHGVDGNDAHNTRDGGGFHIFLNVYNLMDPKKGTASSLGIEVLNGIGMGVHHSGVEVFGEEWSFGCDPSGRNDPNTEGIFSVYPRTAVGFFKVQVDLGEAPRGLTPSVFRSILANLRPKWRSISYHILNRNCNDFACALVAEIDGLFPAGTPPSRLLSSKVPGWINRVAGAGGYVVPDALVSRIMNSLNPPSACAPDLVNFIDIPAMYLPKEDDAFSTTLPPPIGPLTLPETNSSPHGEKPSPPPATTASSNNKGIGFLAGIAAKAASSVRNAVIARVDDMDKKDYVERFKTEGARGEELLSAYTCTVIHINRPQSAKVFIATDCIRVAGEHGLKVKISYRDVCAYHYGAVVKPLRSDGNALPQFIPTADPERTDCILLYLNVSGRQGLRMIPLLDLGFLGSIFSVTSALVLNSHRGIAKNAMSYIDWCYRKYRGDLASPSGEQ